MPDAATDRRPSLQGAFARPTRPTPQVQPPVAPPREEEPDVSAPPREPAADPQPVESEETEHLDEPITNVACHLPTDLRAKVLDTARARGVSITELLFDALDEVLDAVAQGRVELFPRQPSAARSGMPMHRRRRVGGQGTIQVQLRLGESQKQWLDHTAEAHGADSRSAFVTAVFAKYLL